MARRWARRDSDPYVSRAILDIPAPGRKRAAGARRRHRSSMRYADELGPPPHQLRSTPPCELRDLGRDARPHATGRSRSTSAAHEPSRPRPTPQRRPGLTSAQGAARRGGRASTIALSPHSPSRATGCRLPVRWPTGGRKLAALRQPHVCPAAIGLALDEGRDAPAGRLNARAAAGVYDSNLYATNCSGRPR